MAKLLKDLLEEIESERELLEAKGDELDDTQAPPTKEPAPQDDTDLGDEDDEDEEKLEDHLHDGKGHYTASDLKEVIKYVETLIEKEVEEDEDGDKKGGSDVGEIGLDILYQYADLLPETLVNQIVDNLKEIFEVEDTMLESIMEGNSFFTKAKNSPAKQAAKQLMIDSYKKNKKKVSKKAEKYATSEIGKKVAAFHKKVFKGLGKIKSKRLHP